MNLDLLQTGDLVASSGSSWFSKLIKEATGSQYSHLAMAVRGEHIGKEGLYCWEVTGRGVGEVPWEVSTRTLRSDFLTKVVNAGAGSVAVRRLTWPDIDTFADSVARFLEHRATYKGLPYTKNIAEQVQVVFPWLAEKIYGHTEEDLRGLYCWQCVALAWMDMGLLPKSRAANTYPVNEFLGEMSLLRGVEMGPLEMVC